MGSASIVTRVEKMFWKRSPCSPNTMPGRHCAMRRNHSGQRWRSSAYPGPRPAALNGRHGQRPVQTRRRSDQPARRNAYDCVPMPAKQWHWSWRESSCGATSRNHVCARTRSAAVPSATGSLQCSRRRSRVWQSWEHLASEAACHPTPGSRTPQCSIGTPDLDLQQRSQRATRAPDMDVPAVKPCSIRATPGNDRTLGHQCP